MSLSRAGVLAAGGLMEAAQDMRSPEAQEIWHHDPWWTPPTPPVQLLHFLVLLSGNAGP